MRILYVKMPGQRCILFCLFTLAAHSILAMHKPGNRALLKKLPPDLKQKMAQAEWHMIIESYNVRTVTAQKLGQLLEAGADVNTQDWGGKTMLMTCVAYRYPETAAIVRTLLAAGAEVNKTNPAGATPLDYLIIHRNRSKILAMLLKAGADMNIPGKELGNTALHMAAWHAW